MKTTTTNSENVDAPLALPGREAEESRARVLHGACRDLQRKSLSNAIQLGGLLTGLKSELKNATPRRNWEAYVHDHLGIEPRTARNYMRLHAEASQIDTLGHLMKSETISEIGIRDALDHLAELAKAAKAEAAASKSTSHSKKTKSGSSTETPRPPSLRLADGSHINLHRSQWVDGLVSLNSIQSWMSRVSPGSEDQEATKLEARSQRVVFHVAAGINRAWGKAQADTAAELVKSSLDVIQSLLNDLTKQ